MDIFLSSCDCLFYCPEYCRIWLFQMYLSRNERGLGSREDLFFWRLLEQRSFSDADWNRARAPANILLYGVLLDGFEEEQEELHRSHFGLSPDHIRVYPPRHRRLPAVLARELTSREGEIGRWEVPILLLRSSRRLLRCSIRWPFPRALAFLVDRTTHYFHEWGQLILRNLPHQPSGRE